MKGNGILVTPQPRGVFVEGYVSGTPKPGTVMEKVPGTAADDTGRFTWRVYQPGTDGEQRPIAVLLEDRLQGKGATEAYVTGDRCRVYYPAMGEDLNMLKGDVAGTGDDFTVGQILMVDTGTGKVIGTTGSPESESFQCNEAITDPTADTLVWCTYTGH
jgi:hypothetical protein